MSKLCVRSAPGIAVSLKRQLHAPTSDSQVGFFRNFSSASANIISTSGGNSISAGNSVFTPGVSSQQATAARPSSSWSPNLSQPLGRFQSSYQPQRGCLCRTEQHRGLLPDSRQPWSPCITSSPRDAASQRGTVLYPCSQSAPTCQRPFVIPPQVNRRTHTHHNPPIHTAEAVPPASAPAHQQTSSPAAAPQPPPASPIVSPPRACSDCRDSRPRP